VAACGRPPVPVRLCRTWARPRPAFRSAPVPDAVLPDLPSRLPDQRPEAGGMMREMTGRLADDPLAPTAMSAPAPGRYWARRDAAADADGAAGSRRGPRARAACLTQSSACLPW